MIDLPTKADVYCSNGIAGRSTFVVGNPVSRQITHLVVKSYRPPFREYLVPVDQVEETTDNRIKLKCSRNDLTRMDPFEYEEHIPAAFPDSPSLSWPYVHPTPVARLEEKIYPWPPVLPAQASKPEDKIVASYTNARRRNIPNGTLAVRSGARMKATDSYVGQVGELLINSNNMQVSHLILLQRRIFRKREITIPVSQIDHIAEGTIYLKLDRQSVEALPTTPMQRWTRSMSQDDADVPLGAD
jgi:hypothetical protein